MHSKTTAPPVYDPFHRNVVNRKEAPDRAPAAASKVSMGAPPVYRPNQQVQRAILSQAPNQAPTQAPTQAKIGAAPAVYRPMSSSVSSVQPKPAGVSAPPVYRPAAIQAKAPVSGVVQRVKVKMPSGMLLTGGAGVSVIWKKSKKSAEPHVSVVHGKADSKGMIDVRNFHYKFAHAGYYNWKDVGTTTFEFEGGSPTPGVYDITAKQARKFGITLERPASCPEPAPKPKPVAKAAVAWTPVVEEEDDWGAKPVVKVAAVAAVAQDDVPDSWE